MENHGASTTFKRLAKLNSLALAGAVLVLLWVWVPFVPDASAIQFDGINLFIELKPRAIFATLANVFGLSVLSYSLVKVGFLLLWLYLLMEYLRQDLKVSNPFSSQGFIWFGLSFLFAFGPVAYLTLNLGYIDVIAYTLSLLCFLISSKAQPRSPLVLVGVWACGLTAILIHEKSLFDLAIIGVWLCWQRGMKDALIKIAPPLLAAILFLWSVSNKVTSGLPPGTYIQILQANVFAIFPDSLNIWGILLGGGALWILYATLSIAVVVEQKSIVNLFRATIAACTMGALCIAPLIVASDTNRMVDLIWLPCLMMIATLDKPSLFSSRAGKVGLIILCFMQFLIPPFLMYNHGVVPMNCYASYFVEQLPLEGEVKPRKRGLFSLYAFYRIDSSEKACD